jgi:hypothetical protein
MKFYRKNTATPVSFSPARWTTYATAALASGFVGGPIAEGEIHYSGPINQRVRGYDQFPFALGGTATALRFKHFEHFYGSSNSHDGGTAQMSIYGGSGQVAGVKTKGILVSMSNVARGAAISALNFPGDKGFLAERSSGAGFPQGQFLTPGYGFVGFKFNRGAGDQYRWARVRTAGLPENSFEVLDYAYGDPGEAVRAGQKRASAGAQSLGDLAAGSAALRAGRGAAGD